MNVLKVILTDLPLLIGTPEGAAGSTSTGGAGSLLTMLLPFGLIILVFYFLIIRPQSRKQKETKAMLSSLRKNDRITTVGGVRGVIVAVKDDTVIVRVDDNVKMEFSKSAISAVLERKESGGKSSSGKNSSGKSSSSKKLSDEEKQSPEEEDLDDTEEDSSK